MSNDGVYGGIEAGGMVDTFLDRHKDEPDEPIFVMGEAVIIKGWVYTVIQMPRDRLVLRPECPVEDG